MGETSERRRHFDWILEIRVSSRQADKRVWAFPVTGAWRPVTRMRTGSGQDLPLLLGRYRAVGIWDRDAGGVDEKTDSEEH